MLHLSGYNVKLANKLLLQLGAFFGAITAFTFGDKLGRKKTIFLGLLCNAVGAILQIVSWHLPQMIVGRIINGFGMGKHSIRRYIQPSDANHIAFNRIDIFDMPCISSGVFQA